MKSNVVFGLFSLSSFSSAELCRISIILWLLLSTTELEINFCSVLYITKYYTEKQKAEIRWDFSNSSRWFVFQISISVQVDIFYFGCSEFDFSVGVLSELSPNLLDPSSCGADIHVHRCFCYVFLCLLYFSCFCWAGCVFVFSFCLRVVSFSLPQSLLQTPIKLRFIFPSGCIFPTMVISDFHHLTTIWICSTFFMTKPLSN